MKQHDDNGKEDEGLVKRVQSLRKKNHLTQSDFAKKLDLTQSLVSNIESGNANVGVDVLRKLSRSFGVSVEWLLFGRERFTKMSRSNGFTSLIRQQDSGANLQASAHSTGQELPEYKVPGTWSPGYQLFEIADDKMQPTLIPGDVLICDLMKNPDLLMEGSLYVIQTGKFIHSGRIYRGEAGPALVVRYDNPAYEDVVVKNQDVADIWSVRQRITSGFIDNSYAYFHRIHQLETEIEGVKSKVAHLMKSMQGN